MCIRDSIKDEMSQIVAACHEKDVTCKVIFENCYLNDEEKIKLCEIAKEVKPDFIKTSTGFGTGGATFDDVKLMKEHVDVYKRQPSFLQFTSCPHIHSPLLFVNCFDSKIIFIITQKQYTCYKNKCTAFYSWFIMLKRKSILQILLPWQRYCHHLIRIL